MLTPHQDWHQIDELLRLEQYERAAALLYIAQAAAHDRGDRAKSDMLIAAHQICLACGKCHAEMFWHQKAQAEAAQRELGLKQQLETMLNSMSELEPIATSPLPPDPAKTEPFAKEFKESTVKVANREIDAKREPHGTPTFVIYCLGPFRIYLDDQPIQDWKSSKGKSIFKYLAVHRAEPIAKEVLMDLFWPDSTPDAARNNLNVAIYGLRQTLRQTRPDLVHILFHDEAYLLNPETEIWVDVEAFMLHLRMAQTLEQRGELTLAIHEYRTAETLYQGEFLADDRYEDWLIPQRQRLETDYLNTLDRLSRYYLDQKDYDTCATMCKKMLEVDSCQEQAHFRLMQCYSQDNQQFLAMRQYHLCREALANELNVSPSQTTIELYEQIRRTR